MGDLEVDELNISSILLDINDNNATIKSLRSYGDKRRVYNLTVGNLHTYFVGFWGIIVGVILLIKIG